MNQSPYIRPELSLMRFTLRDVIMNSPEYISSNTNGDGFDDPILPDPDDDILWA